MLIYPEQYFTVQGYIKQTLQSGIMPATQPLALMIWGIYHMGFMLGDFEQGEIFGHSLSKMNIFGERRKDRTPLYNWGRNFLLWTTDIFPFFFL